MNCVLVGSDVTKTGQYYFHLVDKRDPYSPELSWVILKEVSDSELLELYVTNKKVYKIEDLYIGVTPYINSVIINFIEEMEGVKLISQYEGCYFYDFGTGENLKKMYTYYMYHRNGYLDLYFDPRNKIATENYPSG